LIFLLCVMLADHNHRYDLGQEMKLCRQTFLRVLMNCEL
jgi:hypothetical protein